MNRREFANRRELAEKVYDEHFASAVESVKRGKDKYFRFLQLCDKYPNVGPKDILAFLEQAEEIVYRSLLIKRDTITMPNPFKENLK